MGSGVDALYSTVLYRVTRTIELRIIGNKFSLTAQCFLDFQDSRMRFAGRGHLGEEPRATAVPTAHGFHLFPAAGVG